MVKNEDTKKIRTWEAQLDLIIHDTEMPAEERSISAYLLEKKIKDFRKEKAQKQRDMSDARYDMEGETLNSKFWTKTAKGYHAKETIYEFRKVNAHSDIPDYETRPKKMAEMARDYHDKIQELDRPDEYAKTMATAMILDECEVHLSEAQNTKLEDNLITQEIQKALNLSKNGSAPGLDGLPYEFYRWLIIQCQEDKNNDREAFDILEHLKELYADIEAHGIVKGTDFNIGWMCPIYKKGDRALISNYRPITLMNTDYKLMTKCHALRLAEVVPNLVHKDQAGFMNGRKIEDQVKQVKYLLNYAEAAEMNAVIVALDQEKAYDTIDHEYLLAVLKRMRFPDKFCQIVVHKCRDDGHGPWRIELNILSETWCTPRRPTVLPFIQSRH
jgi:hypothetical protein